MRLPTAESSNKLCIHRLPIFCLGLGKNVEQQFRKHQLYTIEYLRPSQVAFACCRNNAQILCTLWAIGYSAIFSHRAHKTGNVWVSGADLLWLNMIRDFWTRNQNVDIMPNTMQITHRMNEKNNIRVVCMCLM